jgi:hypothetical protein
MRAGVEDNDVVVRYGRIRDVDRLLPAVEKRATGVDDYDATSTQVTMSGRPSASTSPAGSRCAADLEVETSLGVTVTRMADGACGRTLPAAQGRETRQSGGPPHARYDSRWQSAVTGLVDLVL